MSVQPNGSHAQLPHPSINRIYFLPTNNGIIHATPQVPKSSMNCSFVVYQALLGKIYIFRPSASVQLSSISAWLGFLSVYVNIYSLIISELNFDKRSVKYCNDLFISQSFLSWTLSAALKTLESVNSGFVFVTVISFCGG